MHIEQVLQDILSDRKKKVIVDTDAFNEVDDQFAVAYAILAPERIELLSLQAAPFFNSRSTGPADGMEKSYLELQKLARLCGADDRLPIYRGATGYLTDPHTPVWSDAVRNMIDTAMGMRDERLYIVAIGAATNVASALIAKPELRDRAVVIWLGGNALFWEDNREFNLRQDVIAARVLFESGVPLVQIPCMGVCSSLLTTLPELAHYLAGQHPLCDYLLRLVREYLGGPDAYARSKVLWDIAAVGILVTPRAYHTKLVPAPRLLDDAKYEIDALAHRMIYVAQMNRDQIFRSCFQTLLTAGKPRPDGTGLS